MKWSDQCFWKSETPAHRTSGWHFQEKYRFLIKHHAPPKNEEISECFKHTHTKKEHVPLTKDHSFNTSIASTPLHQSLTHPSPSFLLPSAVCMRSWPLSLWAMPCWFLASTSAWVCRTNFLFSFRPRSLTLWISSGSRLPPFLCRHRPNACTKDVLSFCRTFLCGSSN